ncbi:glycerophosphoryl diester phosphodiesterase [Allopseudospirillum japonicum]|uniref:Glycerophosphoryl diester phosphodiesterase n=1 Tax=Allopseudospirillum japonicum TaxID=64971 RepID=A0A1H6Q6G5_9GAMM|nr:glycerophosphodiester phosphodiesterase family protein [Allopseudospirillum japonicum]SEI39399.1 glycerophosphoryl diester phosphodiesterase [Allopseudospirillum japonicum]
MRLPPTSEFYQSCVQLFWPLHATAVIAHRGLSAQAPENTLLSVQEAAAAGAHLVEVDVQLSADGVPVIFHDETLTRICQRPQGVHEFTYAQLQAFDYGTWFNGQAQSLLSLETLLAYAQQAQLALNLELKAAIQHPAIRWQQALAPLLHQYAHLPLVFSSFDWSLLELCQALWPHYPRAALIENLHADELQKIAAYPCHFAAIHTDWCQLTPDVAHKTRALGWSLATYTCNHPTAIQSLLQAGVQAVFTDDVRLWSRDQPIFPHHQNQTLAAFA